MKKIVFIILTISIFSSCNNKSKEILSLTVENKKLKEEIKTLNDRIDKYKFFPIFFPNETEIKLGENYEAAFFMGVYNNDNPPFITFYEQDKPQIIDTLFYNEAEKGSILSYKPKEKGHYVFFANMNIYSITDTILFPIKWEFEVK